jgi:hypothetical protein
LSARSDSFFCPSGSDDAKHDDALAVRISALNELELTIDHLGVETIDKEGKQNPAVVEGLEEIVKAVGEGMSSFQSSFFRPFVRS